VLTDADGRVVDAMRRLPKWGEISGGRYVPEAALGAVKQTVLPGEYTLRVFPGESFNAYINAWYAEHEGALSQDSLRAQAQKAFDIHRDRLEGGALERLREKERVLGDAYALKEYGDLILAHISVIKPEDSWLEVENFYASGGGIIRIKLDPRKSPVAQAEHYYEQYRKAKNGLAQVRAEITAEKQELVRLEVALAKVLTETNPLILHKLLKAGTIRAPRTLKDTNLRSRMQDKKRPGLSFRRKNWLIMVGRDRTENVLLLRHYTKENDLWLHVRDYPGSYVFIKQHAGKSVPLDILLDAGNLALF
jgi:predicted ribosome quality control (RQC) complex YloA/Tae2 family protein